MSSNSEVVVTGVGVVSPIGVGVEAFWQSLIEGKSGVKVRPGFEDTDWPLRIYAPVDDFDPRKYIKPRKAIKVMCRPIQFGCSAAAMAATDAGLDDFEVNPDRLATLFGTETFFADPSEVADVFRKCIVDKNYEHSRWGEFAMREIQPLWMLKYLPNMVASHISISMDARGPSNSICQGEASSILAIIEGADLIRRGAADVVVAGGTGSRMALTSMLYRGREELSHRILEPEKASRPFDIDRDGLVAGEGAGAVILESLSHAEKRGKTPYGRLLGASSSHCDRSNARFEEALSVNIQSALKHSDMKAKIGHVNAHADARVQNDRIEAQGIHDALGNTLTCSNKGNFGELGPGGSAVELVSMILSARDKIVPATLNLDHLDPACPVNASNQNESVESNSAIKISISSTGQIASLVFEAG